MVATYRTSLGCAPWAYVDDGHTFPSGFVLDEALRVQPPFELFSKNVFAVGTENLKETSSVRMTTLVDNEVWKKGLRSF